MKKGQSFQSKSQGRVVLRLLSVAFIFLGSIASTSLSASAAELGQSCKQGQTAAVTMPVNIHVSLVCTKVAKGWKFTNVHGKLHLASYTLPVAQSEKPFRVYLPILGGKPPYLCALAGGSSLPTGFNYAHTGQVIKGEWNCVVASGSVPALSPGTTKLITPPFTMVMSDASSPIQRTRATLQITIIASGPQVEINAGLSCTVGTYCNVEMATAKGGIEPYTFRLDTLLAGAPPMGMTFGPDGHLRGTPSVAGTAILGVCVVDSTGANDCSGAQIQVDPAAVTPTPTPSRQPQLSDLNGDYNATYKPTWQFDDATVLNQLIPFKFHIANGQITGDLTGQIIGDAKTEITWSPPDGNALVTVPLIFAGKAASCEGNWSWHVDANFQVTLKVAALVCRGSSIYNSGSVTVVKN